MRKFTFFFLVLLLLSMVSSCISNKSTTSSTKSNEKELSIDPNRIAATNFIIDGKKAEIQGNFSEAQSCYQKCLDKDGKNHTAYFLLSQLWSKKDLNTSISYGKKAVELNPSEIYYHKNLLYLFKSAKMWKESEEEINAILKIEPSKIDNYFDLANVFIYQKDFESALKVYSQIETKFGFQEGVILQRKQIYLNQKKYNKAAEEIEKLIEKNPNNIGYYGMCADVYLAMGNRDKAFQYYSKILEINPNDGKVHLAFADYYLLQGKKVESFHELKIAIASENLDIDSKISVMLKYLELSKTDSTKKAESFELLDILSKTNPTEPKALAMKADYYNQSGEYLKARNAFREVIQFDSTKYLVWEQLVLIERELGDYPSLANESYRAFNLFPQYSILFYLNAYANFKLHDYPKAEESINLGKSFCYSPKQQADFFILLGKLKINENQFETAEKYFTEALKIDPNNTSVFCERALMMLKKGDSKAIAEDLFNQACTKEPNNADHWFSFSSFYYQTENYENALKSIQKAKALAQFRPEIYVLEGDIFIKQNKTKEAIESWKKAIELGSYQTTDLQTKINQYER